MKTWRWRWWIETLLKFLGELLVTGDIFYLPRLCLFASWYLQCLIFFVLKELFHLKLFLSKLLSLKLAETLQPLCSKLLCCHWMSALSSWLCFICRWSDTTMKRHISRVINKQSRSAAVWRSNSSVSWGDVLVSRLFLLSLSCPPGHTDNSLISTKPF